MGRVRVAVPPTVEPVDIADVKRIIRQYDDSLDPTIEVVMRVCRAQAEAYTNRAFMRQTIDLELDEIPGSWIELPRAPFVALVSVTYYDTDGASSSLSTSQFETTPTSPTFLRLKTSESWPSAAPRSAACLVFRYTAGEVNSANVPESAKFGIYTAVVGSIDTPAGAGLNDAAKSILDTIRMVPL